ncbi:CopM family metallochaperone [Phyllobacterium bourgognense]|uniref:DUF305 family protein family protein n=1 Tax=Phyllobacterium bourgognense TaxID=314236 RepID=A0A368YYP1_9HYPH|nr:DUF305 domain-containing protein [Phyllobacterium bourgognense]RCW85322.1 DUF305 family protein family protein [Phyllobacterium bourgognense]
MMKITYIRSAALVCALTLGSPVLAQDHTTHQTNDMMAMPKGDQSAPSKAFAEANAKMHKDMAIPFTGNTDKDFVSGMIAHHQGAIDMAKVELEYGKDPEIRKLAETIIAAQETEIKQMKAWLTKNGG